MNNNNEIFENAPVGKAVARMAVPTIISMLVVVIYNMAKEYFPFHTLTTQTIPLLPTIE